MEITNGGLIQIRQVNEFKSNYQNEITDGLKKVISDRNNYLERLRKSARDADYVDFIEIKTESVSAV